MSTAIADRSPLTVAEFLQWEGDPDRIYELIDGEIIEMAPASPGHGLLLMNLGTLLNTALAEAGSFRVLGNGGISDRTWHHSLYAADVVVTEARVSPGQKTVEAPILIAEILSDSTERKDRTKKLPDYQTLASVREVLLIDQYRPQVDLYARSPTGTWSERTVRGLDARFRLRSVPVEISLAQLYRGLVFDA